MPIDGQPQAEVFQYAVAPGARRFTVELMLDVEWEPDLVEGEQPPAVKEFELEVETGKTYQLAARVHINAPAESQLDQSYWEVFLYATD